MKSVTNIKLINRNKKIGTYTTFASLAILGVGLFISFQANLIQYSFGALLVGFLLSQVGIYFGTRYGRSPRPDERISGALKGLENKFTLYNYTSPVPHLLLGPAGIWVLLPYHQGGTITFDYGRSRWRQKGGNLYMKIFAQESLGRPDIDVRNSIQEMESFLKKQFGEQAMPPVNVALVFTNPKTKIEAADAPYPTLDVEKLKDFVRKRMKEEPAPLSSIKTLQESLPTEDVV